MAVGARRAPSWRAPSYPGFPSRVRGLCLLCPCQNVITAAAASLAGPPPATMLSSARSNVPFKRVRFLVRPLARFASHEDRPDPFFSSSLYGLESRSPYMACAVSKTSGWPVSRPSAVDGEVYGWCVDSLGSYRDTRGLQVIVSRERVLFSLASKEEVISSY